MRFSQQLVQVHQIPVHVVDHYLYTIDSQVVLKQPSWNEFLVENYF